MEERILEVKDLHVSFHTYAGKSKLYAASIFT